MAYTLPKSVGHAFYLKLNELLTESGLDVWVAQLREQQYIKGRSRPSIPPGAYFRILLVG